MNALTPAPPPSPSKNHSIRILFRSGSYYVSIGPPPLDKKTMNDATSSEGRGQQQWAVSVCGAPSEPLRAARPTMFGFGGKYQIMTVRLFVVGGEEEEERVG